MDTINGHPGGWYHRVRHGHDPLANIGEIWDKFGVEGVFKYPFELLKDIVTPHGIPFPGTQFLVQGGWVSAKTATEWLSMNAGDVFVATVSFYSTRKLWNKFKAGNINESTLNWAAAGAGVKIAAGVATKNPVLIASGLADGAILVLDIERAKNTSGKFRDLEFSCGALGFFAGGTLAAGVVLRYSASAPFLIACVIALGYALYGNMERKRV